MALREKLSNIQTIEVDGQTVHYADFHDQLICSLHYDFRGVFFSHDIDEMKKEIALINRQNSQPRNFSEIYKLKRHLMSESS